MLYIGDVLKVLMTDMLRCCDSTSQTCCSGSFVQLAASSTMLPAFIIPNPKWWLTLLPAPLVTQSLASKLPGDAASTEIYCTSRHVRDGLQNYNSEAISVKQRAASSFVTRLPYSNLTINWIIWIAGCVTVLALLILPLIFYKSSQGIEFDVESLCNFAIRWVNSLTTNFAFKDIPW